MRRFNFHSRATITTILTLSLPVANFDVYKISELGSAILDECCLLE